MIENIVKNYVKNKEAGKLKIILSDYLYESINKFETNFSYVSKNIDILDEYDGKEFENDKEKWTSDYVFFEKSRLISNFSIERINHLKKVIIYLYPEKNEKINETNNKEDDIISKIVITTGIVVLGVGILNLKLSATVIGALLVTGGVMYNKGKM